MIRLITACFLAILVWVFGLLAIYEAINLAKNLNMWGALKTVGYWGVMVACSAVGIAMLWRDK